MAVPVNHPYTTTHMVLRMLWCKQEIAGKASAAMDGSDVSSKSPADRDLSAMSAEQNLEIQI